MSPRRGSAARIPVHRGVAAARALPRDVEILAVLIKRLPVALSSPITWCRGVGDEEPAGRHSKRKTGASFSLQNLAYGTVVVRLRFQTNKILL